MRPFNICDKCGEIVPIDNDAVYLDALVHGATVLIYAQSRHLLPTANCPGSPSRAQYIAGQPRDKRGYKYDQQFEKAVREAYANLQNPEFVKQTFGA